MKIKPLLIAFFMFSLGAASAFAQTPPPIPTIRATVSVAHTVFKINSSVLGEERTVLVRVPQTYAPNGKNKYPVVYMLDAHSPQNSMMAGILDQQAWGGTLPEMILVGIQNTNRNRDLTPTKTERAGSGGGDKFLDFIEKEVIPEIEKQYRTEPFRVFAGHSLGGLTAVYASLTRPEMFNAYIAASPVLHYDKDFVIGRAETAFKQDKTWNKTIYIALGDEPDYVKGFESFQALLAKSKPKNYDYHFERFNEDNHSSIVLPAYYAGLRRVFAGWSPPATRALADVENHYEKLSTRFGYRVKPPENLVNQIGYQMIGENKLKEAIEIFRRNTELYPNSANVFDSLGEGYEKNGQLKEAAANYEKAYKMAETEGDTAIAAAAKENFQRVKGKIK